MRFRIPVVVIAILSLGTPGSPCTIVSAVSDSDHWVANNLDCSNVFPRIWFVPPTDGQYGRFCFGTDSAQRIAEGGMNDQGLYIGVNAIDEDTGWVANPELPSWEEWEGWYGSGVPDGILAKCANVGEALEVFRHHNLLTLAHVKFLLADASGSSVVVEWSSQGLRFVPRGTSSYQVSTNFVGSNHSEDAVPCYRYALARRLLEDRNGKHDAKSLRGILSATHLEFQTPTVLSVICNLADGRISLFYFHDFEQELRLDLSAALAKGAHGGLLSELVPAKPYVAKVYEDFASGAHN